jgi:hypothetical protein
VLSVNGARRLSDLNRLPDAGYDQIAAGRWARNACQCHTALELNCRPVPTLIRRALLAHHVGIRQSVVQNHEATVDAANDLPAYARS